MTRKLKNTLALIGLLLFILIAGGAYILIFQRGELSAKEEKLRELKANLEADILKVEKSD